LQIAPGKTSFGDSEEDMPRRFVMKRHAILAAAFTIVAAGLAGCGSEPPKVVAPPPPPPPTTTATTATQGKDPAVNVSKDIIDACNITIPDRAPKFDFDSSNLSSAEKEILDQVAKCLTTGPLKGRSIKLIGRADPRGEHEYNMGLGENRGTSVRKYLANLGVTDDHMAVTSRGALDATGTDEAGWQKDRRVDIALQ
jgi:peptidoglycan-associated lipoprotein